jgi:hypothetical protein
MYAPDGMAGGGHSAERFDDGLVHNHHWAVSADETYPCHGGGSAVENRSEWDFQASPAQSYDADAHDRHDDGLVHNHDWAVTGR